MIKHQKKFGKDSEKVSNWISALAKVADLKGEHLTGEEYECKFFEEIVKEISRLLHKCLYVEKQVVGLESRKKEVESLLDISSCNKVCMLEIHGIGGIGKTTLAKALYNSIAHQFDHVKFLRDVRETSNRFEGLLGLQKKLLSNKPEEENFDSIDEGAYQIRNRLCNKRVLLVLDDVNSIEQLKMLAGECNWFGSGSRIIVTTRDRHLLHVHEVKNKKSYEMIGLNSNEALELFCLKAFKWSLPPKEFEDFSNDVIKYAGGVPLALEVISSNLYGKDLQTCVSALDQYKKMLDEKIQNILRVSYDSLEVYQKDIFLDIACFFRGYSFEEVKNIMNACYLGSTYNIEVIIDKSLITVEYGLIQMHDLIQDMGKKIVKEATPKDPEGCSRLWLEEEIVKILEENSGTSKIEGIMLKRSQRKIEWKGTAFQKMKNLRILIIEDVDFSEGLQHLPNSLRILEWNQCPLTLLPPNFGPRNLVVLEMPNSSLKLERPFKDFEHVTLMNFSHCHSIIEVPDMSGCKAIKSLNLSQCKNLLKIHDSVGFLVELTDLNLASCKSLTSLPSIMQMKSLEILNIDDCTSLEHFPDKLESMDRLSIICASNTAIKELPNSIGNLTSLNQLKVSWSANLVSIPEGIRELSNLMKLDMEECNNLQEICEIPSNLRSINAGNCTSLTPHSCRFDFPFLLVSYFLRFDSFFSFGFV